MTTGDEDKGFEWQVGVWDTISDLYVREIDKRFVPVIEGTIRRAGPMPGECVLDLGCGTGSVTLAAAVATAPEGVAVGVDISPEMVAAAKRRAADVGRHNIEFRLGRAEEIPADDSTFDRVVASLSLMYVIDREAAAHEIARVLKPGGRFVGAVWSSAEDCDIVLFQQTAGKFAPAAPVQGVGPGSMGDPSAFVEQLSNAGVSARFESEELGFDFDNFESAWEALAGVTTAKLDPEVVAEAKHAVMDAMWSEPDRPRHFRNTTHFIIGRRE